MAAGDTQITIIGNLTRDPELRYTPTGQAVANFRRRLHSPVPGQDHQRVERRRRPLPELLVWRQAAENVAESLSAACG